MNKTQAAGARKAGEAEPTTRSPAKKCDLVSWDLVATLRPAEGSVFCALRAPSGGGKDTTTLLGTSNGILAADGGGASAKCVVEGDSEPVYQGCNSIEKLNSILTKN